MRSHVEPLAGSVHGTRIAEPAALWRGWPFLACLSLAVLLMLGSAVQAEAKTIHVFDSSFTATGLTTPSSVAVDEATGSVYVLQLSGTGSGTVHKFDADGNPSNFSSLATNQIVTGCAANCRQIAVDNSGGASQGVIYVSVQQTGANARVITYLPNGQVLPTLTTRSDALTSAFCGVATDPGGYVYVTHSPENAAQTVIDKISPYPDWDLAAVLGPRLGTFVSPCKTAVDSTGAVYIIIGATGASATQIRRYAASAFTNTELPPFTIVEPTSSTYVAVDHSNDDVYYNHGTKIARVDKHGNLLETFGLGQIGTSLGVAVNSKTGTVYATKNTAPANVSIFKAVVLPGVETVDTFEAIDPTTVAVRGHVDPLDGGEVTECRFEYVTDVDFRQSEFADAEELDCDPATPFSDPTEVRAEIAGLEFGVTYHFRITAANDSGYPSTTDSRTFTIRPPSIEGFNSANVRASSADLNARIDTRGFDTTYRFEYGITNTYGQEIPVPDGEITASASAAKVSHHISNLQVGVTYHFRVVAINAFGTTVTPNQTFDFFPPNCPNNTLRQQTNAAYLPDCRAYELVSPEYAGGTTLNPGGPNTGRATNPPRLAFTGNLGIIPGAGEAINDSGDLYVATRGPAGWTTKYIGLPATEAACVGGVPLTTHTVPGPRYVQNTVAVDQGMNSFVQWNLGNGRTTCGSPNFANRFNTTSIASNAPHVWNADGSAAATSRFPTDLADVEGASQDFACPIPSGSNTPAPTFCTTFISQSGDLSHFVFSTQSGVYGGTGSITTAPGSAYDNNTVDGSTELISLTHSGDPIQQESPNNGGPLERIQFPALSEDGARILMGTAINTQCLQGGGAGNRGPNCPWLNNPMRLYMRVNRAITYDVSDGHAVTYVDMTSDGSRVYFTSAAQVTADDEDTSVDLFMWSDAGGIPEITRLSAGIGGTGNTDACATSWVSQCGIEVYDGTSISAAARSQGGRGTSPPKALTTGATSPTMPMGPHLTDNSVADETGDIYFYSPETLDGARGVIGQVNLYIHREGKSQYVATFDPSDEYCIPGACSDGPIGRLQVSPDGEHTAFITTSRITSYDNAGFGMMYTYKPATGEIRCVSCDPTGEPSTADVFGSQGGLFMADDGRTAFFTTNSLDPRDTNEVGDVYQYVDGRPQLITSGTGMGVDASTIGGFGDPGLYGISANGIDIFFSTYDTLVGQDRNGQQLKFYTARTNGGFPFNPPPPPCEAADECRGDTSPAPPPIDNGTRADLGTGGNAVPARQARKCAKSKVRRNGRCVKRQSAKQRRATKRQRAKRARANRRAGK